MEVYCVFECSSTYIGGWKNLKAIYLDLEKAKLLAFNSNAKRTACDIEYYNVQFTWEKITIGELID